MSGRYRDAGREAQAAAEAHLAACWEAHDAWEESDPDDEGLPESPAVDAFCGCSTCEVREVLAAAWPILLRDAATLAGQVSKPAAAVLQREADRLALPGGAG